MSQVVIQFPSKIRIENECINCSEKCSSKKDRLLLNSLASGLSFKLQINPDRSLVSVLGKGGEHSNHEAIITWIENRYSIDEIKSMDMPLDPLSKALYQFLDNVLNNSEV